MADAKIGSSASAAARLRTHERGRGRSSVTNPLSSDPVEQSTPLCYPGRGTSAHAAEISAGIERQVELFASAVDLERIGLAEEGPHGFERPRPELARHGVAAHV